MRRGVPPDVTVHVPSSAIRPAGPPDATGAWTTGSGAGMPPARAPNASATSTTARTVASAARAATVGRLIAHLNVPPPGEVAKGARRLCSDVQRDVLRLEVLLQPLGPALAAVAGLLDAAERRPGVGDHALVEADHAGVELLDHAERAVDVLRVDVGDEAVLGVVGDGDRLVLVGEAADRCDRSEDLLAQELGVVRDVREHRRLVEVAGAVELVAADDDLRALADRVLDEARDLAALIVVDERADLHVGLGAAADLHLADLRAELLGEVAGDRARDVEAVRRRARLAAVAHLRDERALDGGVEVGVLEDEERRVAAELHRDAQDLLGRLLDERLADRRRAGERELARPRVLDERLRRLARRLRRDDVHHPARQAGLLQDAAEREHRQRRLLGRLDDARAAGGDRRPDLARAHRQREVPRGDEDARADRLLHRQHAPDAGLVDRVAPVDARRLLGVPAEEVRGVRDLGLRLGDRIAHLERHEQREVVRALGDEVVRAAQDVAPLARRVVAELLEALVRGAEGGVRVVGRGVGDLGDRLAGGRVLDRDRAALPGVLPLAADVQLGLDAVDDGLLRRCRGHGSRLPTESRRAAWRNVRGRSRSVGGMTAPARNLVNLHSVEKGYRTRRVLAGVTLGIAAGDRVGIVGANGAGKSTLLRLIAGAEDPDAGTVT